MLEEQHPTPPSSPSKSHSSPVLHCQHCTIGGLKSIQCCQGCFGFYCLNCAQSHVCSHALPADPPKFESVRVKGRGVRRQGLNGLGEGRRRTASGTVYCQRCTKKAASKKCQQCTTKHYCSDCFKTVHRAVKLQGHSATQLPLSTKTVGYPQKLQSNLPATVTNQHMRQHQKQLESITSMVTVLKESIKQEMDKSLQQTQQMITKVQEELEGIIVEAKLKIVEMEHKIKLKAEQSQRQQKIVSQSFQKVDANVANIQLCLKQDMIMKKFTSEQISLKIRSQENRLDKLAKLRNALTENEPLSGLPQHFVSQIEDIKERVKKLQVKRSQAQRHTRQNSSTFITPVMDKKAKMVSPKTKLNSPNSSFRFAHSPSTQSGVLSSMLSPQQDIRVTHQSKKSYPSWEDRSLATSQSQLSEIGMSNTISSINQSGCPIRAKDIKTDMLYKGKSSKNLTQTPKLTIKKQIRAGKNIENWTKQGTAKVTSSIQSTKKMMTDIRSEIAEFANRYNQEAQTRSAVFNEGELQPQSEICVSNISIESFCEEK